ncbi:hypothetical protein GCM10009096_16440 [Parasphingorhabdus litoris]|uniref:Uncharacterized protein n=1 Tax=Parasphingorhabdus litoris TaxID=394733 RepID=A0ABN1AFX1_9SPHN|nr:hypothetical protein [Parasphingorhabdus litoris]
MTAEAVNPGMFNIFHAKNVKNHSTGRKIDSCRRPFIAQSSPNAKVEIGWYGKEFTHDEVVPKGNVCEKI